MGCGVNSYAVVDPYRAVRRDFERKMGLAASGPVVDLTISESDSGYTVSIDVPGVADDAVTVTVHDGNLVIEGERKSTVDENAKTVFNNRVFGKFRRVLKMDDSIDPESIDAVLENGVLTIQLQRRPEVQPRKISIRSQS